MILRSITEIEDFKLVKDQITTEANVQVIDQDNTGDYGKVIRADQGNVITYKAAVRLKLQSIGAFNPFRDQLNQLKTKSEGRGEGTPPAIKYLGYREKKSHTWLYIGGAAVLVAAGTATYFLLKGKEEQTQGTLSIRVPLHP
jgi:hypothetical protein